MHVDGRILRSARELLLAPGALTAAHLAGRRQPYVAPFQLFLVMNLIFFITQSLTGLNILSVQLSHYFAADGYGAFAQQRVTEHLAQSGSTLEVYADVFNHREQIIAKTLVILMAPMLACVLALIFWRQHRNAPTHLLFAVHFYAYMLLCLTLLFPVAALLLAASRQLGWQFTWSAADDVISAVEFAAILWYFLRAIARVYACSPLLSATATAVLSVAVVLLLRVYRLILFCATLLTT